MGVYVYSLRKKKIPVHINGEKILANLFDYSYKISYSCEDYWGSPLPSHVRSYNLIKRNTERRAQEALESYDGGYVIVGEGDGASIYKNVTHGLWYDTDGFPGEHVGNVEKFAHWLILGAEDPALVK